MAYYEDYDDEEYEELIDDLREVLAIEYYPLSTREIEAVVEAAFAGGLSAEELAEVTNFLKNASKSIGRVAGQVGNRVVQNAPQILQGATTGAATGSAFGPYGAIIGAGIGAAGGLASPTSPKPAAQPRLPAQNQPAPVPKPTTPVPGQAAPTKPAVTGSPAAAQLLSVLFRPEVIQALLAMMMGSAGRKQISIGGTQVPVGAVSNMLTSLTTQASTEFHALSPSWGEEFPEYLFDEAGAFKVDPAVPDQRAAVVYDLLMQADMMEDDELEVADEIYDALADFVDLLEEYDY